MGFTSIDNFINELSAGKTWRQDFVKLYAGGTAIAGNWYDLQQGNGNPAQYLHGNLVKNYDFVTSQQPWIVGTTNWAYTPGTHLMTRTANADVSTLYQTIKMTRGIPYMVTYVLTRSAGSITVSLGGTNGSARSASGTYREVLICGATDKTIKFTPDATFAGTVDLVSVQPQFGGFIPYNDLTEGAMWHGGDTPAGDTKHMINFGAWTNAAAGVPSVLSIIDVLGVYPRIRTDSAALQALSGFDSRTELWIHDCQSAWNEQVITNVTSSLVDKTTEEIPDGEDINPSCVKFAITDVFTTGIIGSRAVALATTSYNYVYSKYVYLRLRSTINLNAGDLSFCTDETANLASSQDVIINTAIPANTWTQVRIDVSGLTATDKDTVISIGLKAINDKNLAYSLYVDDVKWAMSDGVLYNGTFTGNATGWTAETANWAYRSNDVERTANADISIFYQDNLMVTQKCPYRITYTISNRSAGGVTVSLGGTSGTQRIADGTYEEVIVCGTTNYTLAFTPDASFNGRIDDIICAPLIPRCDAETSSNAYGGGVRMYFVMDNALSNGANASTAIVKYTNQDNVCNRSIGATINMTASDVVAHIPHSGVGAGKYGPFIPLAAGDYGIQQVDQFQFSAAQATADAAVDLVVCKQITSIPLTTAFVAAERDLMNQLPSLPRIRDGACLMFLYHSGAVTASGTAFMGYADFAWS